MRRSHSVLPKSERRTRAPSTTFPSSFARLRPLGSYTGALPQARPDWRPVGPTARTLSCSGVFPGARARGSCRPAAARLREGASALARAAAEAAFVEVRRVGSRARGPASRRSVLGARTHYHEAFEVSHVMASSITSAKRCTFPHPIRTDLGQTLCQ